MQLKQAFVGGYGNSDYQTWYPNGQRYFWGNWAKGRYRTWHSNGVLSLVTDTLTADGEAASIEWNSKAEIINIKLKDEAGKYYEQRLFYPGNILGAQGPLLADRKNGQWSYYDKTAKLIQQIDYQPGFSGKPPIPKMGPEGLVSADEIGLADFELSPEVLNMKAIQEKIGYPMIARDAGIEGQVVCRLSVTRRGDVVNYQIVSSPHPILSSAVIARVLQIRFKPVKGKNTFKIYQVNIPFNFTLLD
ncbi:MAG: energy transducer TonB [Bacteroidota bacterium]